MKTAKNRPEKRIVVNVPDVVQKISTLDLIKKAVLETLERKRNGKKSVTSERGFTPDFSKMSDISYLAIVIDGEVVDVMRAQPKLTAMLLSNPTFVKFNPEEIQVKPGFLYEDNKLKQPEVLLKPTEFSLSKDGQDEN